MNPQFNLGHVYDLTTNNLGTYHSGTHEIFLCFQLISNIM
ncbi:hypothetical protein [Maribacter stanieri]